MRIENRGTGNSATRGFTYSMGHNRKKKRFCFVVKLSILYEFRILLLLFHVLYGRHSMNTILIVLFVS